MRDRWNKLMNVVTSREAYLVYGLVGGVTIAIAVRRMNPATIYVISDGFANEIRANAGVAPISM